jgi:hypothetical protein
MPKALEFYWFTTYQNTVLCLVTFCFQSNHILEQYFDMFSQQWLYTLWKKQKQKPDLPSVFIHNNHLL